MYAGLLAACDNGPPDAPDDTEAPADTAGAPMCAPIGVLGCGDVATGSTVGRVRRIDSYRCNPFGDDYSGSPEAVWRLVPDRNAVATVRLTGDTTPDESLDLMVLAGGEQCDPTECLWSEGELTFPVQAGGERLLVVDSWRGREGSFEMTVTCCEPSCEGRTCGDDGCGGSCGTCPDGTLCLSDHQCGVPTCAPIAPLGCGDSVLDVTVTQAGHTNQIDRYSCNGFDYSGPEVAWTFSAASEQVVTVDAPQKSSGEDLDVLVTEAGQHDRCEATACIAHGQTSARFTAAAGATYHIIVDGYQGNVESVDINVTCCEPSCEDRVCGGDGCGGSCGTCADGMVCATDGASCVIPPYLGNDTCAEAVVVTELPFTSLATTEGATADYPLGGESPLPGCAETRPGGPDVLYAFTPPRAMVLRVVMTPAPDSSVTCVEGAAPLVCQPKILQLTAGCPDLATDCLASVDYLFESDGEVEVNVAGGVTYYVMVKGFDPTEVGQFTLSIEDAKVGRGR